VVDGQVTMPEVYAAVFGFGTRSTQELYSISRNRSQDKKTHENDVMARYRDMITYVTNNVNHDNRDIEHVQKVVSLMMKTFWKKDMVGRDIGLTRQLLEASGLPNSHGYEDDVKVAPISDEIKQILIERHRAVQQLRNQNKE
jgi:hypothetical protein